MINPLWCLYRPPGHHTEFIKEFGDFLLELVLAADKVLIVDDFNIHVDYEKDALGSAFIDIMELILMGLKFCSKAMIYQITI